jgi:hypothetical protein
MDTMKDREFLAEAGKSQIAIDPVPGDEVEKTIAGFLKMEPALAAKLKEILAQK